MDQKSYFNIYYQPGESSVFCYRSGLSVYEETFAGGALLACGDNAAGYPLNVLSNVSSRINPEDFAEPTAFHLEIDGKSVDYGLIFEDFTQDRKEDHIHACLTLKSTVAPVRIGVHTVLDGTQMFSRYLTVENTGATPLCVSRLDLLSGGVEAIDRTAHAGVTETDALPKPDQLYSLGYFNNDMWGQEGEFSWHPVTETMTAVDCRFHRKRFRHPIMFLRNNAYGTIRFFQIGWSAGCRFSVDFNAKRNYPKSYLSVTAEITGNNPLLVLRPGETFTSPEVHRGIVQGDLDDAINEMHAHTRKTVLNLPEASPNSCQIGCGMGAEHDMSVETSKAFIDQFAEMGGEVFIVDAGWQNHPGEEMQWSKHNGLNRPDPQRYPNGIEEIVDYCHEKGMKFGLWVEMERLGKEIGIQKLHPEWCCNNPMGEESFGYLDFSVPEAAKYAEAELTRIIKDYKLDLLRVDYNGPARDCFHLRDTGTGIKECIGLRHYQNVYRMYQNLKKRFPNVIFENCAGGGGRTDLGMVKAFNHTWVSDWQTLPRSVAITNGMTMALPPERVDRLFAGMGCHTRGGLDAHMRNIMLGHMSLNVISPATAKWNSQAMDFVRHSVDIYKSFIRPILPECKIYHLTPEEKDEYNLLQIVSNDGTRSALTAIALRNIRNETIAVRPKGLHEGKTYRVTFDNSGNTLTLLGYELMAKGLFLRLPSSFTSELVLLEEI